MINRPCAGLAALVALALPSCGDSPSSDDIFSGAGSAGSPGAAGADNTPSAGAAGTSAGGAAGRTGSTGDAGAGNPGSTALPPRIAGYLRASSPRLVIELDSTEGLAPYPESSTYLAAWLDSIIDKPEGIELQSDEVLEPVGSDFEWTFDALAAFATQHAQADTDTAPRIHVLALDGRYVSEGEGGTVLGLAWGNHYVALFQDALRSRCEAGLLGALEQGVCKIAERNVWAHELGHTLGLVDNGIPMVVDHRDAEHGRHDVREGCLMYWAYDGPQVFDTLIPRFGSQEQDLDLCDESRQDVEAAQ